jgi:hypothetical protein
MMLSVALSKMIYNSEVLFFYNTPNSITPNDVINTEDKTLSPWIYTEIAMSTLLKQRTPEEHRLIKSMVESRDSHFSRIEVEYNIDISALPIIDANFFNQWKRNDFPSKYDALNYLYKDRQRRRV